MKIKKQNIYYLLRGISIWESLIITKRYNNDDQFIKIYKILKPFSHGFRINEGMDISKYCFDEPIHIDTDLNRIIEIGMMELL